jgi:hypothetical protein
MTKKYTDEFLISEIQRFHELYGHTPTYNEIKSNPDFPSPSPFVHTFESWNNALIESGFDVNRKYYTKEDLISEMHRFYELYGHIPIYDEMYSDPDFPSVGTFVNAFGSWNNALIETGYDVNRHNDSLTGNELCSICGATSSNNSWRFYNNQRICSSCFNKTPKEKERKSIRRRELGMKPINNWFENSHFHHLHLGNDHNIGLYIPADLHRSIRHSSKTGTGMDEMNKLAITWFWEQIKNERIENVLY